MNFLQSKKLFLLLGKFIERNAMRYTFCIAGKIITLGGITDLNGVLSNWQHTGFLKIDGITFPFHSLEYVEEVQ